ncbi:MAG: hypothetical protein QF441_07310 [Bacteriovoracaceae bacterium]|jgi:prefoldin subunit 5|nr:hypothetical protein [Halobacteriovoraceae bacterium]MDP7320401.1 hypothetical protein [Bacteriovoracaceae bacterium]
MARFLLSFILFINLLSAYANPDCEDYKKNIPINTAEINIYSEYIEALTSELNELKRKNQSFLGDILVSDRVIQVLGLELAQYETLLQLSKSSYKYNISRYLFCMKRLGYSITKEELELEIDQLTVKMHELELRVKHLDEINTWPF